MNSGSETQGLFCVFKGGNTIVNLQMNAVVSESVPFVLFLFSSWLEGEPEGGCHYIVHIYIYIYLFTYRYINTLHICELTPRNRNSPYETRCQTTGLWGWYGPATFEPTSIRRSLGRVDLGFSFWGDAWGHVRINNQIRWGSVKADYPMVIRESFNSLSGHLTQEVLRFRRIFPPATMGMARPKRPRLRWRSNPSHLPLPRVELKTLGTQLVKNCFTWGKPLII